MIRGLGTMLVGASLLVACTAGDVSIDVDIKGAGDETDLIEDAETIAEAVRDACDPGWIAMFIGRPPGVYVTHNKADGSTDRTYHDCESGEIVPAPTTTAP